MSTKELRSIVPFGKVQDITAVLAGAFAEGVDLGPRGAKICALGESLDAMIEALRLEFGGLCTRIQIDDMKLYFDQLTRMVKAARTYGTGEAA